MEERVMGDTGMRVSATGLGTLTWGRDTDEHEAREQLEIFLDAGGTVIDTAATYGDGAAEELLGDFIKDVVPRPELVIVTKAGVRSEEHTSELQSRGHLVCRLLLEKKKYNMLH